MRELNVYKFSAVRVCVRHTRAALLQQLQVEWQNCRFSQILNKRISATRAHFGQFGMTAYVKKKQKKYGKNTADFQSYTLLSLLAE